MWANHRAECRASLRQGFMDLKASRLKGRIIEDLRRLVSSGRPQFLEKTTPAWSDADSSVHETLGWGADNEPAWTEDDYAWCASSPKAGTAKPSASIADTRSRTESMQASQRTEAEKELREKLEDMKLELDTTRFELEEAQREIEDLDSFLKSSRPGTPTTPPPPYDAPYTNEYTRLAIQTQLGNISDIKALAWTRTAYVPARDWIDRFIQIEDRLRKRVFELAKQHWPDLYAVLAPGGPSAVCFDHEHFARYHGLTDWTGAGLGLASREIQEALRGMVTVRNMNSHRKIYGPQSYSDGNYVLLLLWRCQEMACVLLDEDLAEEIHGLRERVERTALTFKVDTTQWW